MKHSVDAVARRSAAGLPEGTFGLTRRAPMLLVLLAGGLAAALVAAGCQAPAARKPAGPTDPCADRLHDICGQLLLYCVDKDALPQALSELQGAGATKLPPLVCPVSGRPYVYRPEGLKVPGLPGHVVLYDPSPVHFGSRWTIVAGDPAPGQPLALHVLLVPENAAFLKGR